MTGWPAFAAPLVDHAAQSLEDSWKPMDLVEDNQPVFVLCQVQFRLGHFGSVGRQFQVQIEGLLPWRRSQCRGERSFAHLPRSKNRNSGKLFEQARHLGLYLARNHHLVIMPYYIIITMIVVPTRILRIPECATIPTQVQIGRASCRERV